MELGGKMPGDMKTRLALAGGTPKEAMLSLPEDDPASNNELQQPERSELALDSHKK